jgi:GT2 family glycosyltransferase
MDVSVIIVNYNTKDLVISCIRSIYSQTAKLTYEIIVIDNASEDGSQLLIKKEFPEVILVELTENLGFGKANNIGAKKAIGKYLFFLNSDTLLLNNAVYILFLFNEVNKTDHNIGVTGGILLDYNRSETGSFGPLPSKIETLKSILGILPRFTHMTSSENDYFLKKNYLEVGYIMGADMFIRKSIFEEIDGFDSNFFMYYEETDLQLRLRRSDYHNYVLSGIEIIHFEGASLKELKANNKKRLIITKSMFYYFRKHSNYLPFLIFKACFLLLRLPSIFYPSYSFKEKKAYILQIIKS